MSSFSENFLEGKSCVKKDYTGCPLQCFTFAENKKLIKATPPRWILAYMKLESRRWGGWDKCRRLIYLVEVVFMCFFMCFCKNFFKKLVFSA